MTFGFGVLSEISVIAAIDGEGCHKDESVLGQWGLILWILLAIYLMVGQFVLCEEFFVPILAQLGDTWGMVDDVQGATLLAVGSSSPELFTALLGVIFYPDDNPGPGTNVGSAIFNLCIIVGLSAIASPRTAKLQVIPFLRDSISYMIGLIMLYVFYSITSPGTMEIWESITLTGWWILYVFFVYRTDFLSTRCCCCLAQDEIQKTKQEMEQSKAQDDQHHGTITRNQVTGTMGVVYQDEEMGGARYPVADFDQNPDNIRVAPGMIVDEDLQRLLDELNRKQRENVNKGWVVIIMPAGGGHNVVNNHRKPNTRNVNTQVTQPMSSISYVRRRTLMESMAYERERISTLEEKYGDDDQHSVISTSRGADILHKFLIPWSKIFSWTLPQKEGTFVQKHIYLTIFLLILWLGLLTFFVVDCSEKIGHCFNIPGDLLGITLLAIGSSLPDCISSVIVARQMKIDMAVANAFGSNIFDVNLCVGFSFILGIIVHLIQGEDTSIFLGDGDALAAFTQLIVTAAGFMIFLWILLWCTVFRLEKWIGYVLVVAYFGFVVVFSMIFIKAADHPSHGEE